MLISLMDSQGILMHQLVSGLFFNRTIQTFTMKINNSE